MGARDGSEHLSWPCALGGTGCVSAQWVLGVELWMAEEGDIDSGVRALEAEATAVARGVNCGHCGKANEASQSYRMNPDDAGDTRT